MPLHPHWASARPTRRAFVGKVGRALALATLPGPVHALTRACASRETRCRPELLVLALADLHSAHECYAALLDRVDDVLAAHRGTPALIVFNGDLFERANVVALRGEGALDLALVAALGRRAPVVFNLGNHEGALFGLPEAVRRLRVAGATVVSNLRDRRTGGPLADPVARVPVGGLHVAVAGVGTDDLATYRAAVRDSLEVPDSPGYVRTLIPTLREADFTVLLSHDGVLDDRETLALVPDGALLVGAHDHLRFVQQQGRTLYAHGGFWGGSFSLITGVHDGGLPRWTHRFVPVSPGAGEGADIAAQVAAERARHLTPDDLVPVGSVARARSQREAAELAVQAVRDAAGVDVAMVGNTTFGAGLARGPVSRHAFDALLRFDGEIVRIRVDGRTLRGILARTNQFEDTPLDRRLGEFLIASPMSRIEEARAYVLAVNAFVVQDPARARRYLGTSALDLAPGPRLTLKEVVARRLARGA